MKPIDEAASGLKENGFKSAKKCANFIRKGAKGVRVIIEASTKCKEPSAADFQKLMQENVWDVTSKGKRVRTKKLGRNYEKALAEMMDVFNWPTQAGEIGPCAYVASGEGSVEYHANRCRVEYKGTEHKALHMQYCNGVRDMIRSLKKFILINGMKSKFKWSGSADLSSFAPSSAPATTAAATDKKVEEPTKKEPEKKAAPKKKAEPAPADAMDMGALFAELNKGGAITKGMKKVTDDMKVYKNTKLRKAGGFKAGEVKKKKPVKKKSAAKKKLPPPKCEYVRMQRMWYVENQIDGSKSEVEFKNKNESGYLYKCQKGSTITFKGKGKSIQIVNCEGATLIFDDLVAGVELTNCKKMKIIAKGQCQMFRFDKSDSILTYLMDPKNVAEVQFACTMCGELNVDFPDPKDPQNETITKAIPTVFEHKIDTTNGKIVSHVSHLYG